jgi:hypothetical protein
MESVRAATSYLAAGAGAEGSMGRLAGAIVANQMDSAVAERLQSERMMFFGKAGSIVVSNGVLAKLPVKSDNAARLPHLTRTEMVDLLLKSDMRDAATQERVASLHPSLYWNIRLAGGSKNWLGCIRRLLLGADGASTAPYTTPIDWEAVSAKHNV